MNLTEKFKARRSLYDLKDSIPVSDEIVFSAIKTTLEHAPSPFNSQHQRIVVLLDDSHRQLWEAIVSTTKSKTKKTRLDKKLEKINQLKKAYGTILFFDDMRDIKAMQEKYPKAKSRFEEWMHQAQGMVQINIWTLLKDLGIGASLQHYDVDLQALFDINENWVLRAQMPFGSPIGPAKEKDFIPLEERFKVLK